MGGLSGGTGGFKKAPISDLSFPRALETVPKKANKGPDMTALWRQSFLLRPELRASPRKVLELITRPEEGIGRRAVGGFSVGVGGAQFAAVASDAGDWDGLTWGGTPQVTFPACWVHSVCTVIKIRLRLRQNKMSALFYSAADTGGVFRLPSHRPCSHCN